MQTFFTSYLDFRQDCHNGNLHAIEELPQEALDWIPGQDINSIAVLLAHITGLVRYWVGDNAASESSNRDRDAEFRVHSVEVDVFRKRLVDNLEYARNVLDKMSLQDLESMRVSPGMDMSTQWHRHCFTHLSMLQVIWGKSRLHVNCGKHPIRILEYIALWGNRSSYSGPAQGRAVRGML